VLSVSGLQHGAHVEAEAATAAASGAWDVAMLARGGPDAHAAAAQEAAMADAAAATVADARDTAAAVPEALQTASVLEATAAGDAEAGAAEAEAAVRAATALAAPAALGEEGIAVLQLRRAAQPYKPLKAAAEQAAAARQREASTGWRQLRQRADMLALWHEYAAELGIGAEQALGQQAAATWPSDGMQSPAGSPNPPAVGLAVPAPHGQQLQLWRVGQPHPAGAEAVATPPLSPSASAARDNSSSGRTTPTTDSCLTDSSCATSLGVAGRCA
jgi:murein DD-endopeptidase MepM/ murein hydrolase activator NlpD